MTSRKVVVTGASGNVGTALLRRLADTSDVEVTAVVRRPPPSSPPYDSVRWQALDLSDPASRLPLQHLFDGVDTVVHLVWGFQPTRDERYLESVGPDAAARVLAAAHGAGVGHLVHMSSVGAYAPKVSAAPVDEAYPHTGVPTSTYSTHKARAERRLDEYQSGNAGGMTISRVRPGIVLQRAAGAALSRYGLPAYLPVRYLRALPLLPLDRGFSIPVVHSADLADALARIVTQRAGGAFNVAVAQPLTRADIADVLQARPVHVPARVLRGAMSAAWRLQLQPLSPGWLDLAFAVPHQDSHRARAELGWEPTYTARESLAAAVDGMIANAGTASPALRPRSSADRLRAFAAHGPVSRRRRP